MCKKVLTTTRDLSKILNNGCIYCESKNFSYFGVSEIYTCMECGAKYAVDGKGFVNMLSSDVEHDVRIYVDNHNPLRKDEAIDSIFTLEETKNLKRVKGPKYSNR